MNLALLFILLLERGAVSQNLDEQLEKGPLVLVETDSAGKFKSATGIVLIDAGVERVWNTIIDYKNYVNFMPKVVESKVEKSESNTWIVQWEIEMPGPNSYYRMKHVLSEEEREVHETWLSGDLEGTSYHWKLYPKDGNTTIGYFGGTTRNFSGILEKLEDEQQTITVGVNVATILAVVKAIKSRSEKTAVEPEKKP